MKFRKSVTSALSHARTHARDLLASHACESSGGRLGSRPMTREFWGNERLDNGGGEGEREVGGRSGGK